MAQSEGKTLQDMVEWAQHPDSMHSSKLVVVRTGDNEFRAVRRIREAFVPVNGGAEYAFVLELIE